MGNKRKSPAETIATFKTVIKEASKVLKKPGYSIPQCQFLLVANGRLGKDRINALGGYLALREYAIPSPTRTSEISEAVNCIERILKNAKTA